jgi:hypothetical protein
MSVSIARKIFFSDAVFHLISALMVASNPALAVPGSLLDNAKGVRVNTAGISAKLFWFESARERN